MRVRSWTYRHGEVHPAGLLKQGIIRKCSILIEYSGCVPGPADMEQSIEEQLKAFLKIEGLPAYLEFASANVEDIRKAAKQVSAPWVSRAGTVVSMVAAAIGVVPVLQNNGASCVME